EKKPPSPTEGYYNLVESNYTGRDDYTCIIWKRLIAVQSWFRNEQKDLALGHEWLLHGNYNEKYGIYYIDQVNEKPYNNGAVDSNALLPPHRFRYIGKDEKNPALMVKSVEPLGLVEAVDYELATVLDKKPQAMDGYLVENAAEKAGKEEWTTSYQYLGGLTYTPWNEYRGHQEITTIDKETGMRS
ncbi:MAG: hypothetical protein GY940_28460, partial [bacterium]|nr:hypothetical protein [bacterium]